MFIGRESELKFLEDRYSQNGGQLVVLYGASEKLKRCVTSVRVSRMCFFMPQVYG